MSYLFQWLTKEFEFLYRMPKVIQMLKWIFKWADDVIPSQIFVGYSLDVLQKEGEGREADSWHWWENNIHRIKIL